jgi:hypothetical protein
VCGEREAWHNIYYTKSRRSTSRALQFESSRCQFLIQFAFVYDIRRSSTKIDPDDSRITGNCTINLEFTINATSCTRGCRITYHRIVYRLVVAIFSKNARLAGTATNIVNLDLSLAHSCKSSNAEADIESEKPFAGRNNKVTVERRRGRGLSWSATLPVPDRSAIHVRARTP